MQATDSTQETVGTGTTLPRTEDTRTSGDDDSKLEQPKKSLESKSAPNETQDHGHTPSPPTNTDTKPPPNEKTPTEAIATSDDKDESTAPDDDSKYLSGFKLAILSVGLCLTTFVIALDNTIIATAIPKITTVFNSLEDVGWYGSSYLLTTTSLQPSFGKIYTYFDVKYTYLFALVIFEVGSIICAAATSSPMFIVGRAVAGAGAAALYSGGMTIIGFSVPLRKRAIYIAALSSMFGIASVVGPILGVSCLYSTLLSMALYTHIFYLPFYFQAIKGTTAEESGIRTIAYLVSITCSSIVIGGLITVVGWYAPFMWFGSAIFAIGAGMLYTLKVSSTPGQWIGYQILAGIGAGAGVQIPFVAVQVVTNEKDMPTANACVMFFNSLGGALSISIAQNIFVNTLGKEVPKYAPGFDARIVANAGATNLRGVVPPEILPGVLHGYNNAIVTAFILAIATSSIAFFVSLGMEQKSVKGKKIMAGGGA
ncbi:MFS general substrate transporter [Alternaria alternata]|nr:MFS general substrate transporter [Alternaria alternata]